MSRRCALLTLLTAALLLALEATPSDKVDACCGSVVPRREWRALASECSQTLRLPARYVIVSHTAGSTCDSPALCQQQAQNVQHYHMRQREWCDVAYNVATQSLQRAPPARALRAAQNLLACGVARGALSSRYEVKGHRDVQQTLSPGDQLYAIIQTWPRYRG
ncbi:peptidoglycan recognition protein 1 [Echinops telfairi]|uniref:Peptidoglycan recognition protein 1 n=1 Tax=Echinops telfairi TaxID=9371 RepID=A0ABM0ZSC3_ECHTE|nr:peptidoglycan recognition protein 1 [Echinops telfairi]